MIFPHEVIAMTRIEKLVVGALIITALDVGLHLGSRKGLTQSAGAELGLAAPVKAQSPIIGVSLLPRYVITTNQNGNVIYVWEDEGKGYVAKQYVSGR